MNPKKPIARPNMRIGPTTQFCSNDRPTTFTSAKTWGISSYFTLASGGYIIRISPTAMSMFVCSPTVIAVLNCSTAAWNRAPSSTPRPMAAKIQTVR